jgi:FkbM family methyltransferase
VNKTLTSAIRNTARRFGFDISRYHGDGLNPQALRRLQTNPATILDVGAAYGTASLYEAFPDAYRVLIDPLSEYETHLSRWTAGGLGEYHLVAVGAEPGEVTIQVQADNLTRSSVNQRTLLTEEGGSPLKRQVPVRTLDQLYENRKWAGPIVIKIDTEGYEDSVIRGATSLLRETDVLIVEVSVAARFKGSYKFADFVQLMVQDQFHLTDVLTTPRSSSGQLTYMDCVFRREP